MHNVSVSDITMKLAGQSADFSLSFKEKIELAKLLDRLNLSVIELSPIENKKIDSLLVKSVSTAVKHSAIAVPVTLDPDSIETTWAALKEARHPRLQLKAPMSPPQMEYFWHKKPEKVLETIRQIVAQCREKCADVEFIADDACRSERSFLIQAVRTAIEAGATAVTLCDAAGMMLPDEFAAFLSDVRKEIPELETVRRGVQCANALCMANACSVAAIRCGATEVKTSAVASNVALLSELASVLHTRGDAFGVSSELRFTEIKRITTQIERLCSAARSQATGFDGTLQASADFVLSAHDDRAAVLKAVERIGYDLSEEDCAKVYESFQRIAEKKQTISARELDTIVASVAMQVPPTYRMDNYVINCGNAISASAHIRLNKDGETLEGICLGDGPVDAVFQSMEQILGHHYELDDFQIQSVTEGREAVGEAVVRLRSNGKLYSGRGISTDIIGASIHAYLNALNKIVYEEAQA